MCYKRELCPRFFDFVKISVLQSAQVLKRSPDFFFSHVSRVDRVGLSLMDSFYK